MRLAWLCVILGFMVAVALLYGRLFIKEIRDLPATTAIAISVAVMLLAIPLKPRR